LRDRYVIKLQLII